MITIKPFKGVRPNKAFAHTVPCHPLGSYTETAIRDKLKRDKSSFLNIINYTRDQTLSPEKRVEKIKRKFNSFLEKDYLKQDPKSSFYIYRQERDTHTSTGIIALTAADDYFDGKIRIHERTLAEKQERLTECLETSRFQADPVLLTFSDNNRTRQIINIETRNTPLYKYQTENDSVSHTFWMVENRLNIKQLIDSFKDTDHVYIADGHHRMASAAAYTKQMRARDRATAGIEKYNYTLSYLIPESQLAIYEYNRLVKDLNGHSLEAFLAQLERFCTIHPKGDTPYYPSHKHHISMYAQGQFYGLFIKHEFRGKPEGLGELDTYLFEENALKPILNIQNSQHDKRIAFIPGSGDIEGIMKMKASVDSGEFSVGFGFYPICLQDLKALADLELAMPPKSTYIQPKLDSGMIIYKLDGV